MLAFVAGCSSGSSDEESTSSTAFTPVTIKHQYGETTFDKAPTKVVTLSANWSDTLAALDIPITAEIVQKGFAGPNNTFEWTPEHTSEKVEVTETTDAIDIAKLASFQPDVILAGYLPDKAAYDKLSNLAPTIPVVSGSTADSWETVANTAGEIFGKKDEATKLVDETTQKINDFKSAYPAAQGKTFVFAQVQPTGGVGAVNSTDDSAAGVIAQLGFTLNPALAALHQENGPTRSLISPERIDVINSDLLIAWPTGEKSDVDKVPGWKDLTAVKNDTVVYLTNDNAAAFSVPSAPSVAYVIDLITPAAKNLT